jgi:DNA-binding FrmR family transcriptional regulator
MPVEYRDEVKNRLRRIEGQVRGVLGMMERDKSCREVVTQLSAVRSAVDRVIVYVVGENMEHCIREEVSGGEAADKVIKEAIELLMKSR